MKAMDARRKAEEKLAAAKEILELAQKGERVLTDEEKEKSAALKQEYKDLLELADGIDEISTLESDAKKVTASRPQVVTGKPAWEDDPQRGFKSPKEFLTTVMANSKSLSDDRLKTLTAGSDEQGAYSDPYGGFLVPEGFLNTLLTTRLGVVNPFTDTMKIPVTAPSVSVNARVDKDHSDSVSGGLQVYRTSETQTVTATRMEFEQIELKPTKLMGIAYATNEILSDSPQSFVALIQQGFGDEFAAKTINEIINGTGVGQYLGILNSSALIEVSEESSQTADTINYQNLVKMRARCWQYDRAKWVANHDTLPQLMQVSLAVGTGGQVMWQPSAREGSPDRLFGRPIYFTEYAPTLGDKGDIMLVNDSQYIEASRGNGEFAQSIHVRFVNDESCFRFTARTDGAPWWRSTYTPKNGATLSPFVCIEART